MVYGASRVVTTTLLAAAYLLATAQGWSIAHFDGNPGFLGYLQSWDGLDYREVAVQGYPTRLPVDGSGDIQKNPWAFLPLYPTIVRIVMVATGLDFSLAGVLVATLFGAGATLALYRLLLMRFGATTAVWGALFFCCGPMSYVLEVTYAESVFLFFMFCSLIAMMSRRYLLMMVPATAAAFAHPGALALAAALGIHCVIRLLRREPFPVRARIAAAVAIVGISIAGFAWPLVAAAVTGDPSAYFETELAWWSDYIGRVTFLPFTQWFLFARHYWGAVGVVLVVALLAAFAWWLSRRSVRAIGTDLLGYTASYTAYLVAVFLPQQSLFRMLLPLSPLLGHPVLSRSPRNRRITLAVCVALQPVGILLFWVIWPP
jgi:hypothetical protein